jgi:hypothetical protein
MVEETYDLSQTVAGINGAFMNCVTQDFSLDEWRSRNPKSQAPNTKQAPMLKMLMTETKWNEHFS